MLLQNEDETENLELIMNESPTNNFVLQYDDETDEQQELQGEQ